MKTPTQGSGRWRNLIAVGAIAGLLGTGIGWGASGVGIKYENRPVTGSSYRVAQTDCINYGLVLETSPGGFNSGSGTQVITCLSTRDGSIIVASGALLMGPPTARTLQMSGSQLDVRGVMSGAIVSVGTAADRKNKLVCFGTGGRLGYCQSNSATDCGCLVP